MCDLFYLTEVSGVVMPAVEYADMIVDARFPSLARKASNENTWKKVRGSLARQMIGKVSGVLGTISTKLKFCPLSILNRYAGTKLSSCIS